MTRTQSTPQRAFLESLHRARMSKPVSGAVAIWAGEGVSCREGTRVTRIADGVKGTVAKPYVPHPAPDVVWVRWDHLPTDPFYENARPINVKHLQLERLP